MPLGWIGKVIQSGPSSVTTLRDADALKRCSFLTAREKMPGQNENSSSSGETDAAPKLLDCIRCGTHEYSEEGVYSVRCECGRGTCSYDREYVIRHWNNISQNMAAAEKSAYWKAHHTGKKV